MFAPYNPNLRLGTQQGQPAPADDWHLQWGGTPEASGPGGGDVPFQAGTQPPPMPDWSQYRGQPPLGGPPGVDWNRGYGRSSEPQYIARNPEEGMRPSRGGYDDRGQWNPNPGWMSQSRSQELYGNMGGGLQMPPAQPAPQQGGGGFTPLSQLGRGLGRLGGALGLPWGGGGSKPAAPQTPPPRAPGSWNGETEMLAPEYGGGPAPGNRIMPDGSSWLIGISAATSRQLTPPGTFDPKTQRPVTAPQAPGGAPSGGPGGGMVLLRAPNGQTRQVPADQVDHYLARGAMRG